MNIHEYQAKQVLARFGVPVPKGQFATTPDEAAAAFTALGQPKAVVKAQIHAGGRGKAGGVKLLTATSEVRDFAAKLLGKPLVTHQTGPKAGWCAAFTSRKQATLLASFTLGCSSIERREQCP